MLVEIILPKYSQRVSLEPGFNPDQFDNEGSPCHFQHINEKPPIIHIFTLFILENRCFLLCPGGSTKSYCALQTLG